jgi:hypothetical protein
MFCSLKSYMPARLDASRAASRKVHRQRGVASIEYIGIAAFLVAGIVWGGQWWGQWANNRDDNVNAGQFQQAMKGANTWLNSNSSTLAGSAVIPWSTLAGSMPTGLSATNTWGQSYQLAVQVVGTAPNQQVNAALETVGGATVPENRLRSITQQIGTAGGYVVKATPTTATGGQGGWGPVTLSLFGGTSANVGVGHLVGALFYQSAASINGTYLWRNAVPGQPQLNQMETAIDLNNNNLNNVATANAQTVVLPGVGAASAVQVGGAAYSGTGGTAQVLASGLQILNASGTAATDITTVRDINASGTVTATGLQINGNAAITGNTTMGANSIIFNSGTQYLTAANGVEVSNLNGGNGKLTTDSRLTTNEYLQVNGFAVAGTACSSNGLQGNSGTGPLFCQSGVWKNSFQPTTTQYFMSFTGGTSVMPIGSHQFCTLGGEHSTAAAQDCIVQPDSVGSLSWHIQGDDTIGAGSWCIASCIDQP